MAIAVGFSFLLFFLPNLAQSLTDDFVFHGFDGANMTLDGASIITSNGAIQLTNQSNEIIGHAFYPSPLHIFNKINHSSFSTSFVFAIVPSDEEGGGHGLAFTISPSKQLPGALPSHYLGLFNPSNDGNSNNHVFAVEFDMVNGYETFADINGNHVGINVNSMKSNPSQRASYYVNNSNENEEIDLESGQPIQVWIEYDGVAEVVNVTISPSSVPKPSRPLLSHPINLSHVLKESMYVGFSASTGKLSSSHYILGWSFQINGVAQPLELSRLPSPPPREVKQSSSKFKTIIIIALVSSVVTLLFLALVIFVILNRLRSAKQAETLEDWELDCPHRFRYKDLYVATKGFKASEILGTGGFGVVYKGVLPTTGEEVAVKKISHNSIQGVREFVAEIETLGRLRHKHLVHLLGWCKRKEDLLLVYDFVVNGSLEDYLFNSKNNIFLSWEQRFKILKGIASGLLYLHEEWERVVVHRDIKASNVLLEADMNARLGDFGLARLYDHGENPRTTCLVGTLGYIAPELSRIGKATASSDVFAFGALLLVVACGRGPLDPTSSSGHLILLDWVSECDREGRILEVVDPKLKSSSYAIEEMHMVLKLGLLCSESKPEARPTMRQVTRYLNGDDLLPTDDVGSGDSPDHVDDVRIDDHVILHSHHSSVGVLSSSSLEVGR